MTKTAKRGLGVQNGEDIVNVLARQIVSGVGGVAAVAIAVGGWLIVRSSGAESGGAAVGLLFILFGVFVGACGLVAIRKISTPERVQLPLESSKVIPDNVRSQISIRRPAQVGGDVLRAYQVLVDGKTVGSIKFNRFMPVDVTAGPHKIQVLLDSGSSSQLDVVAEPGTTTTLLVFPTPVPPKARISGEFDSLQLMIDDTDPGV